MENKIRRIKVNERYEVEVEIDFKNNRIVAYLIDDQLDEQYLHMESLELNSCTADLFTDDEYFLETLNFRELAQVAEYLYNLSQSAKTEEERSIIGYITMQSLNATLY